MTDLWCSGIVAAPMCELLAQDLAGRFFTALPESFAFTFLACPFGLWRHERCQAAGA